MKSGKRKKVKCHCGALAYLRPASVVYGADAIGYLYICSRYPVCDSYVGTHERTKEPKGTLADGDLRHKRIEAHRAFDTLWKNGGPMKRGQAYVWLQAISGLNSKQAHIGQFSSYMCEQLIERCNEVIKKLAS